MPRLTPERSAQRRAQIVDATIRCIVRYGFQGATMAQIIAESGLSAGAVYAHFPSKNAILAAVAPKPVNLLINAPFITVAEAAALGVRRISVGGTLARTAWAGFLQAAGEIMDTGTFSCFQQLPKVDELFGNRLG